jgi:hypothetical protein
MTKDASRAALAVGPAPSTGWHTEIGSAGAGTPRARGDWHHLHPPGPGRDDGHPGFATGR